MQLARRTRQIAKDRIGSELLRAMHLHLYTLYLFLKSFAGHTYICSSCSFTKVYNVLANNYSEVLFTLTPIIKVRMRGCISLYI